MNKTLLSRFSIAFFASYVFVFILAAVLVKTGIASYETHVGRYWKNSDHLVSLIDPEIRDGSQQVYAFSVPGFIPGSGSINATINTIEKIYEGTSNIQGFVQNTFTGILDTALEPAIGCTFLEAKDMAGKADWGSGTVAPTEDCDMEGALINKTSPDEDLTTAYQSRGGILGLATALTKETTLENENLANISLYAGYIQKQVPFVGTNSAYAYAWENNLQNDTLGDGFFNIWKMSLRFAYYLIIIPTVAFGFAIMFRMQINPQTQITLMRAIPRLLITILLITFSYPISALMVTLVKPITDIVIGLIATYGVSTLQSLSIWELLRANGNGFVIMGAFMLVGSLGGGLVGILVFVSIVVVWIISVIRYLITTVIISFKAGLLIGFGPLILLFSAFPGKEDLVKQYFLNVASLILGLGAISVMYASSFYVLLIGFASTKLWILVASIFMGIGLLWNAPKGPKYVEKMLGVQPLFGGEEPKKR